MVSGVNNNNTFIKLTMEEAFLTVSTKLLTYLYY